LLLFVGTQFVTAEVLYSARILILLSVSKNVVTYVYVCSSYYVCVTGSSKMQPWSGLMQPWSGA